MNEVLRTRLSRLAGMSVEPSRLLELGLRLRVWWSKDELTRALAHGLASTHSQELALRAGQITAKSSRATVADSIDDVLRHAHQLRPALSSRVPFDRSKVRRVGGELAELASRLRSAEPVRAQGMARVVLLLTDVEKPLYGDGTSVQLLHAIIDAEDRL